MWSNEVIFSGGDLAQRERWIEFMHREYGFEGRLTEETAWEAVELRRNHIKHCIERLQEELELLDVMATELLDEDADRSEKLPCFYNHNGVCQRDGSSAPIGEGQCESCADFCVESWRVDSYLEKKFSETE